jgi:hypothetical protein
VLFKLMTGAFPPVEVIGAIAVTVLTALTPVPVNRGMNPLI